MNDRGSPYRQNNHYGGRGGFAGSDDGGQPPGGENVEDYMLDFKEKRKLLVRWNHYFPHENAKEFDVSENNHSIFIAQRF